MQSRLKKIVSGGAACAVTAGTVAALLAPTAAFAVGAPQPDAQIVVPGTSTPLNSGGSATNFGLRLPLGSACTGDSANDGYRIQSYMVPQSRDPGTIQFSSEGPIAAGSEFSQPLIQSSGPNTGNPLVNEQTATAVPAGGPGPIIQPLPSFNFVVFPAGFIPAGVYNLGIACTLGPPSATQQDKYWNTVMTVTTNPADSPAQISWAFGAAPVAPTISTVTPGNGTLTVNYTAPVATPATSSYTITATPATGPAVTTTSTSPTTATLSGLTNGTAYSVSMTATNGAGTSPASNSVSATPAQANHPAVQNLTATPVTGGVNLDWTEPADFATTAPTGYTVTNVPSGGTTTVNVAGTSASVTGLTAGTVYSFTVTATYATAPGGTPATVSATPLAAQVLTQTMTVTRPVGALVFTQVCGKNGAIAADTSATIGFPTGSLPAVVAAGPGTAPEFAGGLDPKFSEYPYPENADGTPAPNYPTNCGVALGNAKLVKKGSGGGQFFAASGVLNQVTVVDTRDTDIGWNASGNMGAFTSGPGKTFSGSQLGWTPVATSDTAAFTDSDGVTYNQVTAPGGVVLPNTLNATGMSSGRSLGTAAALAGTAPNLTGGLGIAEFDARLKLLIPITAKSGTYTGVLTISAV